MNKIKRFFHKVARARELLKQEEIISNAFHNIKSLELKNVKNLNLGDLYVSISKAQLERYIPCECVGPLATILLGRANRSGKTTIDEAIKIFSDSFEC